MYRDSTDTPATDISVREVSDSHNVMNIILMVMVMWTATVMITDLIAIWSILELHACHRVYIKLGVPGATTE